MDTVYEVKQHKRANGQVPVFEAVQTFGVTSKGLKDKVLAHIDRLQFKSKHSGLSIKKAEANLWYLRVRHGRNRARIFFTYLGGDKIILLNGYLKKTRRMPAEQLEMARQLLREVSYA